VINRRLPDVEGKTALSFRELIEIRFVRHFLRAGVSWHALRRAARAGWNQEGYWRQSAGVIRWLPSMIDAMAQYSPPVLLSVPHRWSPAPIRRFQNR
jgi:hypothetical protein